mmetsp:Transcript_89313/g.213316  ORF Transcript_89313/g.213316 Transcript_89313/m.213316 type:complete len:101 (-) Transcript_89313:61-363(-)
MSAREREGSETCANLSPPNERHAAFCGTGHLRRNTGRPDPSICFTPGAGGGCTCQQSAGVLTFAGAAAKHTSISSPSVASVFAQARTACSTVREIFEPRK